MSRNSKEFIARALYTLVLLHSLVGDWLNIAYPADSSIYNAYTVYIII